MRMDDAIAVGKIDVALYTRSDVDASTRILCELTSGGLEPSTGSEVDAVHFYASHTGIQGLR